MFDFNNANDQQRRAIVTTEGPVLIIAGPGTGKTYTLVQRVLYLIEEKKAKPEEIFIATFTEKAAKELITRITNEMERHGIEADINDMYIGTFHSICMRIIKDNLEFTRLRKDFRLLDTFDQEYLIYQNIWSFRNIPNFNDICGKANIWQQSKNVCSLVNKVSDMLVTSDELKQSSDPVIQSVGEILEKYKELLQAGNYLDFTGIQTETYCLLNNNQNVINDLKSKIKYIMVDEYQDTNYIQEQLVFMLLNPEQNICVVGDDDQGLYRFRGATIRNILEFPKRFEDKCTVINLSINYRSDPDIVSFYNRWMNTTEGDDFGFYWNNYRFKKHIVAHSDKTIVSPAVVKLSSIEDEDEWHQKVYDLIQDIKKNYTFRDYNQIAFLFRSVRSEKVTALAQYLEEKGINVYSPRSDMFFKRKEIMIALGCLLSMFITYYKNMSKGKYSHLDPEVMNYYQKCVDMAVKYMMQEGHEDLRRYVVSRGKELAQLKKNANYGYAGILYQLFAYEPFKSILDTDLSGGTTDVRPLRNLSILSQCLGKFEYIYGITVITSKSLNKYTELLFNTYFQLLYKEGIPEFEDEADYAPSGCVSFMTIHQSKGLEFPIVVVGSLWSVPRNQFSEVVDLIEDQYGKREPFEPANTIKYFDFWRLFYTAFSRAQDMLVLTYNDSLNEPSKYFKPILKRVTDAENTNLFKPERFIFHNVKSANLKNTYSFTSDIILYDNCSRQYKFYRELEFQPVRASAQLFGRVVHETIEDIHKAAIRGDTDQINNENIEKWFNTNYDNLSLSEHSYLDVIRKKNALLQIERYAERQAGHWNEIQDAEVDVSYVKPDYIIDGKIDLIKGENNTVELVDFKSEKKPDLVADRKRIEQYRRQLHVYAYLVEHKNHQKVSKMNLYFTGEENGVPTITYPYTNTAIEGTMASFDDTVHQIMEKKFDKKSENQKLCDNCDFRFYCHRNKS